MNNSLLQEKTADVTLEPMARRHTPKRMLIEVPLEQRALWPKMRVAALMREMKIGAWIMEAVQEKLEREERSPRHT